MNRPVITGSLCGLLLACHALQLSAANIIPQHTQQQITPAPGGPFRVARNEIVDSHGRLFLVRGTQLTEFHPETTARDNRAGEDFGPHSATSLSAIRLRFNMNAVRLPVNIADAANPKFFSELAKVVHRANQMDLLLILAAREPGASLPSQKVVEFWGRCAAFFKDYPNVMFDAFSDPEPSALPQNVDAHSAAGWEFWRQGDQGAGLRGMEDLVRAIRSAGAAQPVVVMSWKDDRLFEGAGPAHLIHDPNIIYEASPRYATTRTDAEREAHFGYLAGRVPVLANGWDLNLSQLAECLVIPADPTAASQLVQGNLDYFDAHQISWIVSTFEPGKLINDLSLHDATSLENGWTCGQAGSPPAGLGRVIQAHMRANVERGLFVVSGAGGVAIARGAFALAYGPIMAERDSKGVGLRPPKTLGRIAVEITDAFDVIRPAGILWASQGWGQVNFVIPAESAPGPAHMTIVREDGSSISTNITIANTAPSFLTGHSCRGPAIGSATQAFADGHTSTSPLSFCKKTKCSTIPAPVTSGATTRLRIYGSGFRYAGSAAKIEVTIGGIRVPVVSFGPMGSQGEDQLTIEMPAWMRGLGETDLIAHVDGQVSNAVRIRIGGGRPVS